MFYRLVAFVAVLGAFCGLVSAEWTSDQITQLLSKTDGVRTDLSGIASTMNTISGNVSTIKADVATVKADVATVKADVATIKGHTGRIATAAEASVALSQDGAGASVFLDEPDQWYWDPSYTVVPPVSVFKDLAGSSVFRSPAGSSYMMGLGRTWDRGGDVGTWVSHFSWGPVSAAWGGDVAKSVFRRGATDVYGVASEKSVFLDNAGAGVFVDGVGHSSLNNSGTGKSWLEEIKGALDEVVENTAGNGTGAMTFREFDEGYASSKFQTAMFRTADNQPWLKLLYESEVNGGGEPHVPPELPAGAGGPGALVPRGVVVGGAAKTGIEAKADKELWRPVFSGTTDLTEAPTMVVPIPWSLAGIFSKGTYSRSDGTYVIRWDWYAGSLRSTVHICIITFVTFWQVRGIAEEFKK